MSKCRAAFQIIKKKKNEALNTFFPKIPPEINDTL